MTDHVWVSKAMQTSMLILYAYTDIFQNDRARAIEGVTRNDRGEFVSADMCPKRVWLDKDEDRSIPDMFFAEGQCIVSARVAEILSQFDLGNGALYPVTEGAFRSDNTTPIAGSYFSWIFGGMKSAFLEAHSPAARPNSGGSRDWCVFPFAMSDGAIAVSRDALGGSDVWVDPLLLKSIFVSGALGDALEAAGLREALCLFKCQII
ncbi:hypothetical protein [Bradyrhizobium sp. JYMT SZCCT0180]|uniref:hypothetical protein n=1 Tax=Bradyrhizobium sp. JYMT SZCCT0180 TaxID=2807666 RepID=UPI001BA72C54|nr:hypothetical protein [Bradyrhizobium sp. JYMT SZCCT0180]MBR1210553.1 hypothetical protein [Bradyrhizobium sp. JYMT SZCCT0180]